jgi:hypothetical protein
MFSWWARIVKVIIALANKAAAPISHSQRSHEAPGNVHAPPKPAKVLEARLVGGAPNVAAAARDVAGGHAVHVRVTFFVYARPVLAVSIAAVLVWTARGLAAALITVGTFVARRIAVARL